MRTARSSGRPGGSPPGTPPGADPPGTRLPPQSRHPPGPGTPSTRHPPCGQTHTCKHTTLPQTSFAGGNNLMFIVYGFRMRKDAFWASCFHLHAVYLENWPKIAWLPSPSEKPGSATDVRTCWSCSVLQLSSLLQKLFLNSLFSSSLDLHR